MAVSNDLTVGSLDLGNDSGSPLYIDNRVYGVKNSGNGNYGSVKEIRLIRSLIVEMTEELRGTD